MISKVFIIAAAILSGVFSPNATAQTGKLFSGKFSSEGDVTASGIMTMELSQTDSKIEGVSNYQSNTDNSDSGMLSVNGYVKNNIGYIRFRDQRGNTVADGNISIKDATTLYFKQTTTTSLLPSVTYLYGKGSYPNTASVSKKSYTGSYSNEGDTTAKGIISFQMTQSGSKIEGTANYKTNNDQLDTGILSVNGYVKGDTAYIRFRDQKGQTIADGILFPSGSNTGFKQTTSSNILPIEAILYR
ncbi:hypothetical protein J2786_003634 [Chryseobacterium vietnamense]|uniref:Uncharacterized protein n=1 Tax=Chryseobacterium vietnamense TaxID=866785 RepID=A0ACC6JCC8_9FLAO|nr:hypothetical protein [Chryseobacterium vietnamense]MDR6460500.1 hypothetical protein [Chryseobacterium vietnamense]